MFKDKHQYHGNSMIPEMEREKLHQISEKKKSVKRTINKKKWSQKNKTLKESAGK